MQTRKMLTFSYDDGVLQDGRLAEILNKYGLKCTFNINTGLLSPENNWEYKGAKCIHMTAEQIKQRLAGHELAVHGLHHLDLPTLTGEEKITEIKTDKENIERIFGVTPRCMAYAYGTYDDESVDIIKGNGIEFSRTVKDTHSFEKQTDLLRFNPTCHHNDPALFELAEQFLSLPAEKYALFYVWGHSYEFDGDGNWERIERFCRLISGKSDIVYGTNSALLLN